MFKCGTAPHGARETPDLSTQALGIFVYLSPPALLPKALASSGGWCQDQCGIQTRPHPKGSVQVPDPPQRHSVGQPGRRGA